MVGVYYINILDIIIILLLNRLYYYYINLHRYFLVLMNVLDLIE